MVGLELEAGGLLVVAPVVLRRDVDQPGARTERHRLPVVAAERTRTDVGALVLVVRAGNLHGPSGLQVDVRRPVHRHIRIGGQQLAGGAIQHVEEPVLRRLHDHLARATADREVGQHHRLHRGVVPGVARHRLVMPDQLAVVGIDGQDRRQVQVVATTWAADLSVPRRSVAGADVEQVDLGVVDDRVPHRAAAAVLPPVIALPGWQGLVERLVFLRLRRITRHGVEAPRQLAGLGIVGRHITAHAVLGAAIADDDLALGNARGAGDGVGLLLIDRRHRPRRLAALGIDGHEPAVEHADVDATLIKRRAAIDDVTAGERVVLAMYFGVVLPELLSGLGVDGVGHAPGSGGIHHPVDHQRRGLEAAIGRRLERPRQAQLGGVGVVDLIERAEALLVVVAPVRQPVLVARVRLRQGRIVHRRGRLLCGNQANENDEQSSGACEQPASHRWEPRGRLWCVRRFESRRLNRRVTAGRFS